MISLVKMPAILEFLLRPRPSLKRLSVVTWENQAVTGKRNKERLEGKSLRDYVCVKERGQGGKGGGKREFTICMHAPINIKPSISNVGSLQIREFLHPETLAMIYSAEGDMEWVSEPRYP